MVICLERGADLHMIWLSWYHCHSLSPASVKFRLVLPFWYQLTRVVLEKGPLNGCVCVYVCVCYNTQQRSSISSIRCTKNLVQVCITITPNVMPTALQRVQIQLSLGLKFGFCWPLHVSYNDVSWLTYKEAGDSLRQQQQFLSVAFIPCSNKTQYITNPIQPNPSKCNPRPALGKLTAATDRQTDTDDKHVCKRTPHHSLTYSINH